MPKSDEGRSRGPRYPARKQHTLTDLEQIKVLADSLRVRLLESFCEERTTKQVADLLGEKPTRLYHHVEALERVGLIELTRTRPNRGTLEKYYLAVARTFCVDRDVFPTEDRGADGEANALRTAIGTYLDRTAAEIGSLIERGEGQRGLQAEGIITFCEIHASGGELQEFRRRLMHALDFVAELDPGREGADAEDDEPELRFRLTLAYYPLGGAAEPEGD